ncbi:unnamed protein product [Adineta steineri]|uniref:TIR domain-containing protein n=1 Tax=Adineta steineri TaxID=433720 RepID=A0A815IAU7_9BILA|nr:unnamed protein product [Adineta steineri]CAF1365896.1 unnamed protein product [Adineta steineri]CAF1602055.1 unnamed protein product [Adineta steineri]CAF1602159.1 unnamed protein product [Adineta steineri]
MGQCCYRQNDNIITPVDDTDNIPMNSSIAIGQYHLMISYSLSDRSICHRLATNLIRDGFRVWFESNPTDNEFEFNRIIHKVIDNSDCVILCISNTYSQTYRCQKEVRYASDMKKRIIMIKVEDDYVMNDWLSFIEPGKIQFQLSNNDLDFKNNYQQILKELRRIIKFHSLSSNQSLHMSIPSNKQYFSAKERRYRPLNTKFSSEQQIARR